MAFGALRPLAPLRSIAALICLAPSLACSSLHVPVDPPSFKSEEFFQSSYDGIALEVRPIEGTAAYWEMFDENLPEAGIGAVWARIHNSSSNTVQLKDLAWELRTGMKSFSHMNSREVLKQFYRGTGRRMHSLAADDNSLRKLERTMFKPGPLAPAEKHEGFVFVRIPTGSDAKWYRNGVLTARGIRLANGKKVQIQIPLSR